MTHVRTRVWALLGLLVLGCRSNAVEESPPTDRLEPSEAIEQPNTAAIEQPKTAAIEPEPEPEPAPAPEPVPTPEPPTAAWQPITKPDYIQDKLLRGSENHARYALANDQLRYYLDLRVRDESTRVTLTERDSGHTLTHEWPTALCSYYFLEGEGAGAALGELAHDPRGRKLLALWVSCRLGEDIINTETVVLLVLVDTGGLSTLWSGKLLDSSSHVCAAWEELEMRFTQHELFITKSDRAAIFLPEEIPGYDCDENSPEHDIVRERHRVQLP